MAKKPTTPRAEKKPSLDIKDEMYWADKKRFDWLSEQTPEMAKTFSALIAMKWYSVLQSSSPADYAEQIINVNEAVNVGFWELSHHPDLQWRLMCGIGRGRSLNHGWIPLASKRKTVGKVDQVLLGLHPGLNDQELEILRSKMTVESLTQLLRDMAWADPDITKVVQEFKKAKT